MFYKIVKAIGFNMKIIKIDSCLKCPLIKDCKNFKALKKSVRFSLLYGVDVKCGILKTCKLEDYKE